MYTVTLKWWVIDPENENSLDLEFVHYAQAMDQYHKWIARYSVIISSTDGYLLITLTQEKDLYHKFEATTA